MTKPNIIISTTPAELQKQWCVYELYNGHTAVVEYIGCCKLSNLFSIPDARSNVLFDQTFEDTQTIMIRLISQHGDKLEARRAVVSKLNDRGTPSMNVASFLKHRTAVECITTGEMFQTAKDACKAHNLTEAQLSNHLNGVEHYNTCKGRKYRKILNNAT